jgi:phospholipase D1/2
VYARRQHDDVVGAGYGGRGEGTGAYYGRENEDYEGYQQSARNVHNRGAQIDSVSQCYMQDGPSIFGVPWFGSEEAEMDAFVSEELYIHSKLLIADDQIVICGSANLNDRSQLGDHDSEIAVVIQDYNQVDSYMNNEPYQVAAYASSLRRHIFRKHIGLLIHQDPTRPDVNFTPIDRDPNFYDWGSPGDVLVRDVLSDDFDRLWNETANINSQVFTKAFHAIPCDNVRSWEDYDEFFGRLFIPKKGPNDENIPCRYEYGHVVKDEFRDVRELKDWLSRVKGNLVEMPLQFMDKVDFAQEGLSFNAFTDVVYT